MPCPKCNGIDIVLGGRYKIKRSKMPRQRLKCNRCKATFIIKTESYRKKVSLDTRKKIISLYKTKKPYKSRFGNLHKDTYSTREIAKMLDVSKSFVYEVIKKMPQEPTEADINEYNHLLIKLKLKEIVPEYVPYFTERQEYFMERMKK